MKAKSFVQWARALQRHYKIQFDKIWSLSLEHGSGTFSFLLWTPRLLRRLAQLTLFDHVRHRNQIVDLSQLPVIFINLEHREDRRIQAEAAFQARGLIHFERFSAIRNDLGILGCTQSHIGALEKLELEERALAMICEDDVEFLGSATEIREAIQEFANFDGLDVLCLAYRLRAPRFRVSRRLALANSIQTASCYVVKRHAVAALLQSFRESEQMLLDGVPPRIAANDMHWKEAQTYRLLFAITRKRLARQRPSFSDVVGRFKNYRA